MIRIIVTKDSLSGLFLRNLEYLSLIFRIGGLIDLHLPRLMDGIGSTFSTDVLVDDVLKMDYRVAMFD